MQETVKNEEQKNMPIFILKIIGNVIFYAIIIVLFLFSLMNINGGNGTQNIPHLFGKGYVAVASDSSGISMEGNVKASDLTDVNYAIGSFEHGSLLKEKVITKKNASMLKVGDVITFYDTKIQHLSTHRIVYIYEDGSAVITQGDKVAMSMPFQKNDPFGTYNGQLDLSNSIETVTIDNIKGVVTSVKPGGGAAIENIQKNWLFYFVIPVLLVLLFEVFMVVKNIMDLKGAKQQAELETSKDAMMADLEAQKEEMRKQILAELAAAQGITLPADKPEEPKPEEVKTEEPVVEEVETVEPAAEETVVEETPVVEEDPAVEEPVVEETPVVEEAPVEEVKTEEPVAEETPAPAEKKKAPAKKTTTAKKTTGTTAKKTTTTKKATTKTEE